MSLLERAVTIAHEAHAGQRDKAGDAYVEHCRRVADAVETLDEKIVAWLHDVVEKSDWTLDMLTGAGFGAPIVEAVDALSRRDGEGEAAYLARAASCALARPVKVADIEDNLRQCAWSRQPTAHYRRVQAEFARITRGSRDQPVHPLSG